MVVNYRSTNELLLKSVKTDLKSDWTTLKNV